MLKMLKNMLCHSAKLIAILPRDLPICQARNLLAGHTGCQPEPKTSPVSLAAGLGTCRKLACAYIETVVVCGTAANIP